MALGAVALGALALAVAGCYSLAEPSLRPGDSRDVLRALTRQGVRVMDALAGDSACADPGLVANALRLAVTVPTDSEPRDVYVYSFRVRDWDESEEAVDACQAEFAAANPGGVVTRVDVPTYRAFGLDWPDELALAVEAALEEASQAG